MPQGIVLRSDDRQRSRRFAAPCQDIEDQVVARRAGWQRLPHGGFDEFQAIGQHGRQHAHEPPVGIIAVAQLASQPDERRRQFPVLEGCTVA